MKNFLFTILFSLTSLFSFGQTSYVYDMDTLTSDRVVSLNMTNNDELVIMSSTGTLFLVNYPSPNSTTQFNKTITASDVDFSVDAVALFVLTVNVNVSLANVLETSKLDFTVYPNPTVDVLNVRVDNYDGDFEVFDLSGKLLIKTSDKSIDVSYLNSGIYFLLAGNLVQKFNVK